MKERGGGAACPPPGGTLLSPFLRPNPATPLKTLSPGQTGPRSACPLDVKRCRTSLAPALQIKFFAFTTPPSASRRYSERGHPGHANLPIGIPAAVYRSMFFSLAPSAPRG